MKNTNVLISGASIAGPALAYWLSRYGFHVTVVERAPELRAGGQAIDVRGPALEVAERMGILSQVRELATGLRGASVVDASGKELYRSTEHTFTGGQIDNPDVEIMRDDLCRIIHQAIDGTVEYLFNDSITSLTQDDREVHVTFERSAPRTFDLVVGADGLHSTVRKLAFGPESDYIHHLGSYIGLFTAPNFLDLDYWQTFHQSGELGGIIMSARNNKECRVFLGFEQEEPLEYDYRDVDAQKRLIAARFADAGWEFPRALKYMWDAPDFHFDSMSQIRMDSWSRGRVVLLGDAGYCGSPMTGQGTSLALIGAYVLAGELKAAGGDHRAAFAAYEEELRDHVRGTQQFALDNKARREEAMAAVANQDETEAAETFDAGGDMREFYEFINSFVLKGY
ncbi:FAD-dependent oxidoreductase [Streptomyces sp. NRRL F-4489]|uniref:FAD-dependent monooxygenase n=1 Tax=Streptomyces sp. NRRL F-4489 TaxID=1609095 RepID=UPI000749F6D8|nr:FAD-dependent monooxygenase [Streptomyces sp. NRRL F-4489]KUL46006.1 FAD-dependent oxidoreductase [Streptomyces sp. NRRL F-4489]